MHPKSALQVMYSGKGLADDCPKDIHSLVSKIEALKLERFKLAKQINEWVKDNDWELEREEEYDMAFERRDELDDEIKMLYLVYYFMLRDKVSNVCRDNLKGYYAFDLIEEIEAQMVNLIRDREWEDGHEQRKEEIEGLTAMFYRQTSHLYGAK